jgi:hypothetical protein
VTATEHLTSVFITFLSLSRFSPWDEEFVFLRLNGQPFVFIIVIAQHIKPSKLKEAVTYTISPTCYRIFILHICLWSISCAIFRNNTDTKNIKLNISIKRSIVGTESMVLCDNVIRLASQPFCLWIHLHLIIALRTYYKFLATISNFWPLLK